MNRPSYNRRTIRLPGYDYAKAGLYFITICTKDSDCIFGEVVRGEMVLNPVGQVADACWRAIPEHYPDVVLHAYVVMPNHVHGILELTREHATAPSIRQGAASAVGGYVVGAESVQPLLDGVAGYVVGAESVQPLLDGMGSEFSHRVGAEHIQPPHDEKTLLVGSDLLVQEAMDGLEGVQPVLDRVGSAFAVGGYVVGAESVQPLLDGAGGEFSHRAGSEHIQPLHDEKTLLVGSYLLVEVAMDGLEGVQPPLDGMGNAFADHVGAESVQPLHDSQNQPVDGGGGHASAFPFLMQGEDLEWMHWGEMQEVGFADGESFADLFLARGASLGVGAENVQPLHPRRHGNLGRGEGFEGANLAVGAEDVLPLLPDLNDLPVLPLLPESLLAPDFQLLSQLHHLSVQSPTQGASRHEYQKVIPRSIGSIVRGFKTGVTKWCRSNTDIHTPWQRNYHDRILRSRQAYDAVSYYIFLNPSRWQWDTMHTP